MLNKVLVPLGLREPMEQIESMFNFQKKMQTKSAVLLHVGHTTGRLGDKNRSRLETLAAKLREKDIEVEYSLKSGSIPRLIRGTAQEYSADYISLIFRKKNWLQRAILGSKVKDLIRLSELPVLVYKKAPWEVSEDVRVLYATSFSDTDKSICSFLQHGGIDTRQLLFLHVGKRAPDPQAEEKRRLSVIRKLKQMQRDCGSLSAEEDPISLIGSPRRKIPASARRESAHLILLGKADSSSRAAPVFGSTSEEVSYNAACSVLIIPHPDEM